MSRRTGPPAMRPALPDHALTGQRDRRLAAGRAGLLALCLACVGGVSPAADQPADDAPLARIGSTVLTRADLSDAVRAKEARQALDHARQLREEELAAKLAEAELATADAERLLNDHLLAMEATARRTTPAKLIEALPVPTVTPAQARRLYDEHAKEINQPYASVESAILDELTRQRKAEAKQQYVRGLRARYHAQLLIEPLRFDVEPIGPARGAAGAPVTMILFADFQCPYCAQLVPVLADVLRDRAGDVRLVYRHLPLDTLHPLAAGAARAAVCADRDGRFWPLYDALFANPKLLAPATLRDTVVGLGVDGARFDECVASPDAQSVIDRDVAVADQIGLSGTPALFINGRLLRGTQSLGAVLAVVDDELARRAGAPPR